MRTLILFLIIALTMAQADALDAYYFKDSGASENLFVEVVMTSGIAKLAAEKQITFCILETTNEIPTPTVYFPKAMFFCNMQLFNSNGVAVGKTLSGERYGQQFFDLKAYSWESVNKVGHNTGGSERPDMVFVHTNGASALKLPSAQELFKVKDAGNYKLLIKFQVFKMIGSGTNHTFRIVQIPQMEVPVVKGP